MFVCGRSPPINITFSFEAKFLILFVELKRRTAVNIA